MKTMVSIAVSAAFAGLLCVGSASAADKTPQQQRMVDCNKAAGDKKLEGDARKQFMSSCLSGKSDSAAAAPTQQEKMKTCNEEAGKKNLKGDDRKKFMSSCLSG